MAVEKADTSKSIRTKGYTKTPRITYERFYAIRYTITVEVLERKVRTPKEVWEFYGISDQTYNRILRSADYMAYKQLLRAHSVKPGDELPPANATIARKTKRVQAAGDDNLDKAIVVLEKAENVLMQAYDVKKRVVALTNATPAQRKPWYRRSKA